MMKQKKIKVKIKNEKEQSFNRLYFDEKLGLDQRDNAILSLIQKNPNISQEEIASVINLSQPSVGARIRKLKQNGILHTINGVNFKVVDLKLAKVDVNTTDTISIIDEFKNCPFFINALITSGRFNITFFFTATDLKRLEGIVNHHLRKNPKVKDIELSIVIGTAKDFVLPLNIMDDKEAQKNCDLSCIEAFKY